MSTPVGSLVSKLFITVEPCYSGLWRVPLISLILILPVANSPTFAKVELETDLHFEHFRTQIAKASFDPLIVQSG